MPTKWKTFLTSRGPEPVEWIVYVPSLGYYITLYRA